MTKQDLEEQLKIIDKKSEAEKIEVIKRYCDANNPYKIGDKFTDHVGTIIIEKIGYSNYTSLCCTYFGLELKKDGKPRKEGSKRVAYQSNDINK